MEVNLENVEKRILKENYLLMLGFLDRGYVPLRIKFREEFIYLYDPVAEGVIAEVPASTSVDGLRNLGYVEAVKLGSNLLPGRPINVFAIDRKDRLYQLFYGIAPSWIRVGLSYPAERTQRNLELYSWTASSYPAFGFIDGFKSPLLKPSEKTEMFILPKTDFAFTFINPAPIPAKPLLLFVVNRLIVEVIRDAELVKKMIDRKIESAIRTVAGLSGIRFDIEETYGIHPIPLSASEDEIKMALKGG
jgi:hypothetical protein